MHQWMKALLGFRVAQHMVSPAGLIVCFPNPVVRRRPRLSHTSSKACSAKLVLAVHHAFGPHLRRCRRCIRTRRCRRPQHKHDSQYRHECKPFNKPNPTQQRPGFSRPPLCSEGLLRRVCRKRMQRPNHLRPPMHQLSGYPRRVRFLRSRCARGSPDGAGEEETSTAR